ncbi:MAG: UDP-glucose 4-epimerase GalE [Treponema sp.]|nr:UDP-glucose 4-epimerase GalE [Treponema sp.]
MNVLIIGGAGYIGSHVAAEFLARGHAVTVFDNLSSGLRQNLLPGAGFVHGDIHRFPQLLQATADGGFGAVIHLAASKAAGESMLDPEKYSLNNISGSVNIINAASQCGIRTVVFSSSAAVYGEPEYLPIDELHRTEPANYYGFTKLEVERILGWYQKIRGIRYACLRYFNAAGYDPEGRVRGLELNPANLLPLIMEVACGLRPRLEVFGEDWPTEDGTCVRDYVHVGDLAAGHVAAVEYLEATGESLTVNLGSGSGISVRQLVELARGITGRPIPATAAPRRPGDPAELTASGDLAARLLGWKARLSDPETLVRTTWNAYRATYG